MAKVEKKGKGRAPPQLYKPKKRLRERFSPVLIVSIVGLIIMIGSVVASSFSNYFSETQTASNTENETESPQFTENLIRAQIMSDSEIQRLNSEGKTVLRAVDFPTSPSSKELSNLNVQNLVIERINYNDECFGKVRAEFTNICPPDATKLPVYIILSPDGSQSVVYGYKTIPELVALLS
ncbi:MAG: hypothetical protein ABH829_04520 [archaeon]